MDKIVFVVLEDDPEWGSLIQDLLRIWFKYEVIHVKSATLALALIDQRNVAAVVTNVRAVDGSKSKLIQAFEKRGLDIPLIIFTSNAAYWRSQIPDRYPIIEKPNLSLLAVTVARFLRRKSGD